MTCCNNRVNLSFTRFGFTSFTGNNQLAKTIRKLENQENHAVRKKLIFSVGSKKFVCKVGETQLNRVLALCRIGWRTNCRFRLKPKVPMCPSLSQSIPVCPKPPRMTNISIYSHVHFPHFLLSLSLSQTCLFPSHSLSFPSRLLFAVPNKILYLMETLIWNW